MSESARTELEWQHIGSYYTDPENLHQYLGHALLILKASYEVNE